MLLPSSLIASAVTYLTLARTVTAKKDVVADKGMPLVALILRLLALLGYAVSNRAALSTGARPARLHVQVIATVRMSLGTVGNLLLPEPPALNSICSIALPSANVEVGGVDAGRVVAAVAGIFDAGLPAYQRRSAQVSKQPPVRSMLFHLKIEEAVSALISWPRPEPAFGISATVDFGPEGGLSLNVSHAVHSTPCAIPNWGVGE